MSSKSHASSHIDKTHKQEQSVQSQPVETESLPHVVRKVESGRDVVSPQNMLQLQRSVGNRAVVRRMTVPVTQLTPQVRIQRADLDTLYGDRVKENLEKQQYLDDFKKIQTLLKNKQKVLQILRGGLLQTNQWEGGLANFEGNANFSTARPTLIGFVPADFFRAMVGGGQAFEDSLGGSHGIHSHRIQWYVVAQDIQLNGGYHHTNVIDLYKEASSAFWEKEGKFMWDEVVDRTEMGDEFAAPEWLSFHLSKEQNFRSSIKDDQIAGTQKKQLLKLWETEGPKDDTVRSIFTQVAVADKIFTGFSNEKRVVPKDTSDSEDSSSETEDVYISVNVPTVVYKDTEAVQIPTG